MDEKELLECRGRLEEFLENLLEPVGRAERRQWGSAYVRGLLLEGKRKSIEPMASRLPDGNIQAMQQFIGQSPWDPMPVRRRLAEQVARELVPACAWIVDDTGFPKQGTHSVGVARQYSGTLGKIANCQVAVTAALWTGTQAWFLGAKLYLSEAWLTPAQRARARIPSTVRFQEKWRLALTLLRQVRAA